MIHEAFEDYLEAVLVLQERLDGVHAADVARFLNVKLEGFVGGGGVQAVGPPALVMLGTELLDRLKGLPAYSVLDPAGILGRDIRRDSELDEELRDDDMPLVG